MKTIEEQILHDLAEVAAQYPEVPKGAKTIQELMAAFPGTPRSAIHKWLAKKIKSGGWLKARSGNKTFYWPAK